MSYQRDRDQFVATMTREGLPLWIVEALLRAATGIQRRAELACSSEAADRDRVPCPASTSRIKTTGKHFRGHVPRKPTGPCLCDDYPAGSHAAGNHSDITRITLQDYRAEQRLIKLLAEHNVKAGHYTGNETQKGMWHLLTAGDPRGFTLRVIPPSYDERNKDRDRCNPDSVGVPARDSRLRF